MRDYKFLLPCPHCRERPWAFFSQSEGKYYIEGHLGCPFCGSIRIRADYEQNSFEFWNKICMEGVLND